MIYDIFLLEAKRKCQSLLRKKDKDFPRREMEEGRAVLEFSLNADDLKLI